MPERVLLSLERHLRDACARLMEAAAPGAPLPEPLIWGPPRNPEYGDLSSNAAMLLAKPLKKNPFAIAEELASALAALPEVERLSVARPGFLNAVLSREALGRMLLEPIEEGAAFGRTEAGAGQMGRSVLIEFVSANPTGPMHVGHARHAAVGDSLARLLDAAGWRVHREYYINDAGNQIQTLGRSLRTRVLQILGDPAPLEENGYPGDYLIWTAWDYLRTAEPQLLAGVDEQDLIGNSDVERFSTKAILPDKSDNSDQPGRPDAAPCAQRAWIERAHKRLVETHGAAAVNAARARAETLAPEVFAEYAKTRMLDMIRATLTALRCPFDSFFSETRLYKEKLVEAALDELRAAGATYESEGALWLRSTDRGDDKDRVLVKSDGAYTYLLPDVAYHRNKFLRRGGAFGDRGPDMLINLFGSDHDGYAPRLKAALSLLGLPAEHLNILLMRLVFLVREGERLDMGKRSGNFVSARDLLDDVGCDVLRFFLQQRSANSEINFDLDLAREHSDRNPVFKIQYAHARVCSLLRRAEERGLAWRGPSPTDIEHLTAAEEKDLIREIARLPEVIANCARALEPHPIAAYLLGLADLFNRYWSLAKTDPEYRMIVPETPERTQARLTLAAAFRVALANGLALLGVSAPERMEREEDESSPSVSPSVPAPAPSPEPGA